MLDLLVDDDVEQWGAAKVDAAAQPTLFFQGKQSLEQVPYRWQYHYRCSSSCAGHKQSMIDWELSESWRRWRERYDRDVLL